MRRRLLRVFVFFVLFLLILVALKFMDKASGPPEIPPLPPENQTVGLPGVPAGDSLPAAPDSAVPTTGAPVTAKKQIPAFKAGDKARQDDSLKESAETENPIGDTTAPQVRAMPGPGLHPAPIEVTLSANEPAEITYSSDLGRTWVPYHSPIRVMDSLRLIFLARDTSGNLSDTVPRFYRIGRTDFSCPDRMVPVGTGGLRFCMDRFEWPNRKGNRPEAYVNWYQAYDSCRTYKKRLCTALEWEAACGGESGNDYPYGERYEIATCNTEGIFSLPSGSLEECRSPAGVYDLSGNLREWTSTRSVKNDRHFQVYGGYWENRGASRCNSTQYSFFPENRFVSVGFRCCAEPAVGGK